MTTSMSLLLRACSASVKKDESNGDDYLTLPYLTHLPYLRLFGYYTVNGIE